MTPEAETLLKMYNDLIAIKKRGSVENTVREFFGRFASEDHSRQFRAIQNYALRHEDAVLELATSQILTLSDLMTFMFNGVRVTKSNNPHLISFIAKVDQCADKLTRDDASFLNWLHTVHGY